MAEAWVTLATNDTYAMGALVLSESLVRVQTTRSKVVLITTGVSASMKSILQNSFNEVIEVDVLNSNDPEILAVMKRPELGVTLTKIYAWSLTSYAKCVFLDADTLVVRNADDLFDREELSAAPDIGWPDCFNSGVFVFVPNQDTFKNLLRLAATEGSFDGGDQGLLNIYFANWFSEGTKHLSFIYNMTLTAAYSWTPAYRKFGKNVKIVHFIGSHKPWLYGFNSRSQSVIQPHTSDPQEAIDHVQTWWMLFTQSVQPMMTADCSGLAGTLARLDLSPESQTNYGGTSCMGEDVVSKRKAWEAGHIDYLGGDAFENIQKKLDESIRSGSKGSSEPQPESIYQSGVDESQNLYSDFTQWASQSMTPIYKTYEITIPATNEESEDVSHHPHLMHETNQPLPDMPAQVPTREPRSITSSKPSRPDTIPEEDESLEISETQVHDTLPRPLTPEKAELRRRDWETGNIDYLGEDSFENIWTKIEQSIKCGVGDESKEYNQIEEDQLCSECSFPEDSLQNSILDNFGEFSDTLVSPPEIDRGSREYSPTMETTYDRRRKWEAGQIDYLGQDSFENILEKLNHSIIWGVKKYKFEPLQIHKSTNPIMA